MPHKVHAARIPSSAESVIRSTTATDAITVLYTVPAGKTLVILSAFASVQSGTCRVVTDSEDDESTNALVGVASVTEGIASAVHTEVRVKGGVSVSVLTADTPAGVEAGFAGYLENA
jgi:hypothetical protein